MSNFTSVKQVHSLETARSKRWDMIVVGAGMGGAALAYGLGEQGFSVLLIEQGIENPLADDNNSAAMSADPIYRAARGRWPTQIKLDLNGSKSSIWPALGSGLGGSTLLYGAALSRLEPRDFESRKIPGGREVKWPFSYKDLHPHYVRAEQIFKVSGTADPLSEHDCDKLLAPPAMGECDRYIFRQLQKSGLHPYRSHNGIQYVDGCTECGGHFCARNCKSDARSALILPSLERNQISLLARTEVLEVITDGPVATGVKARRGKEEVFLTGDNIAIAAGSLVTPLLLKKSRSLAWPEGIGNNNDLVGRNLMFHASDFVALWPKQKIRRSGPGRTIALRDFYDSPLGKLGEFQSMGLSAGYPEILTYLHQVFDQSMFARLSPIKHLLRVPAFIGGYLFNEATVFSTIVEDNPYLENRVVERYSPGASIEIKYIITPELKERVIAMRKMLKESVKGIRLLVINRDVTLNYGHACGTCSAGDEPDTSVLDTNCKVHAMDNLYVVDGSFMPTSGGTNPSLTIAANGLRVAAAISAKQTSEDQ
ncbi:MAG: GMC oxidoreductase [bacterium]